MSELQKRPRAEGEAAMSDYRVEIIGVDDAVAAVKVTDGYRHFTFSVSATSPAHQLLRQVVINAAMQLKRMEIEEWEREFAKRARQP